MNKVKQIQKLIQSECKNSKHIEYWFYEVHLLGVEKMAKLLLQKLTKANKEIVLLGVWLHDLQRIRGIRGNHAKAGAVEAGKVLKEFGYSDLVIKQVKNIILTHSCDTGSKPTSLEGKILATADAMSHYINDFYLQIATTGQRNLGGYKKWVLEKLDRDYNKKIFFPFAKKMIKDRHDTIKKFVTMK